MDPSPLEYGADLWDSLHIIQMQSEIRSKQMRALKSFFRSYKDSLSNFQ